jgi:hypothetical protein
MRTLFVAASAAVALSYSAGVANAAPLASGLKSAIEREAVGHGSLVQKSHGFHRYCARGPRGWHRHGRFGQRIPCYPRRGRWY